MRGRTVTAATRHKMPSPATAKASRAKPRYLEALQQRLFVKRWRLDPRTRDLPACAIPNGGKRGKVEAALLKAEGVERGAPDWMLFAPGRGVWTGSRYDECPGLALEFKSPNGTGRQSPEQREWQRKLEHHGWRYALVTSAEDAWRVVLHYLALAE